MRATKSDKVYRKLAEIVNPRHTALVVVDMQNDYCHPNGAVSRASGRNLRSVHAIIPKVRRLVEVAREAGVFVVWLLNTHGAMSDAPAVLRFRLRYLRADRCVEGTWGHALIEGLIPQKGEPVIHKYRSSGFTGTPLDMLLDANAIKTMVVIGVATEGCVDSTARDALFHNYYAVCVTDAMASTRRDLHDAALTIMRARYDTVSARKLTALWSRA